MRRHWAYLKYVVRHKWFVFREGLKLRVNLWQLLIHDWSKFLPSEWFPYARTFYTPNGEKQYMRDGTGFDAAWNHHQKCQPHHWQYWLLNWDQPRKRYDTICFGSESPVWLTIDDKHTRICAAGVGPGSGEAVALLTFDIVRSLNSMPEPLPMPDRYRREMLADWRGAGLALGKPDTRGWYLANRDHIQLHPETRVWIEKELGV